MAENALGQNKLAFDSQRLVTARGIALLFVLAGLFISGYLSYTKLTAQPVACVAGQAFDCGTVTNSRWSELAGIDIAYLGFAMYATVGLLLLLERRLPLLREYGRIITFAIGLVAWLYSMFLVYLQFFVLQTLCSWCLAHEFNMTLLFGVLCYRLWRDLQMEITKE